MKTATSGIEFSAGSLWFRCVVTGKTVSIPFAGDYHDKQELYKATSAYYRELRASADSVRSTK